MGRWSFYDPVDSTTYTFETNPKEGGTPSEANDSAIDALGGDGLTLYFGKVEQPSEISISGVLLSQGQLEAFEDWCSRPGPIRITNDHGGQQWAYIRSFDPEREGRHRTPWRHTYTISMVEADAP